MRNNSSCSHPHWYLILSVFLIPATLISTLVTYWGLSLHFSDDKLGSVSFWYLFAIIISFVKCRFKTSTHGEKRAGILLLLLLLLLLLSYKSSLYILAIYSSLYIFIYIWQRAFVLFFIYFLFLYIFIFMYIYFIYILLYNVCHIYIYIYIYI